MKQHRHSLSNLFWSPHAIGQTEESEKEQKRATKLVHESKILSYSDHLKYLNLPTLHFRRCRGDMIEILKIIIKIYDEETVPKLTTSSIEYTRGHQHKLPKRVRYDIRKYYFMERIAFMWNILSDAVVNSSTINQFKNRLFGAHKI